MRKIIPLQNSVVYGPIPSRRLGNSLGINILPVDRKVCSSNCVYCQYGWTPSGRFEDPLKRSPELLTEIESAFESIAQRGVDVDCITLAGNGEPTLHPELGIIIQGLMSLRDRYFPKASLGILSDSTQVVRPKVRQALALLDVRYMKMDAGDEAMWRSINQPLGRTDFQTIVHALRELPEIILQSLFVQGSHDNTRETHVATWIEKVAFIHPRSVQVYTVDRGTAAPGIIKVSHSKLKEIADHLRASTGIAAEIFD